MKQKILVMFDCFGVVSSCALLPYFVSHFGEQKGKEYNAYYSKVGDMGEMSLLDMAIEMSSITKEKKEDIISYWVDNTVVDPKMKKLLKELKEKYYVVLASNAMEGLVEQVFAKHDLYPYFDKVFVSYKYKDVKPNKSYFDMIINSFDFKFDKVILIDDYDVNINAVNIFGIIGIQHKDLGTTIKELKEHLK